MPLHRHRTRSVLLAGNPLGDPTERDLLVYVPPGHDPQRPLPALLALAGFAGTGAGFFSPDPLAEELEHRLDRLIGAGLSPPILVVAPDCFTRVGGSQYLNSSATGPYQDYLAHEIVPEVTRSYRVSRWGVFGKSSGGFGALTLAMHHPDLFEACACHSGDSNFELCYLPDFAAALDAFSSAGGPARWLERFWSDENRKRRRYFKPLNVLGMAAAYSPNPAAPELGIDFPFDLQTGGFRPEVWARWRERDPVLAVTRHGDALAKLRLLYLDCGTQDEYGLMWGARAIAAALRAQGLTPHYEEFSDGHSSTSYRYDRSIPLLARALEDR